MGVARLLFALAPGDLFGFAPSVLCLSRPGRLRAHGNRGRKRGWQASGPGFGALWGPLRGCARLELPARSEREPGALHRDQGHGVRSMPILPEAFSGPAQTKIRALLCNLASPYRDRPRGGPTRTPPQPAAERGSWRQATPLRVPFSSSGWGGRPYRFVGLGDQRPRPALCGRVAGLPWHSYRSTLFRMFSCRLAARQQRCLGRESISGDTRRRIQGIRPMSKGAEAYAPIGEGASQPQERASAGAGQSGPQVRPGKGPCTKRPVKPAPADALL